MTPLLNSINPILPSGTFQGTDLASFAKLGKAFSLRPGLTASAVNQVMIDKSGLNHLSLAKGPQDLNPINGKVTHSDAEIKQVAKNFESIFLEMMMKEMRNSVQKSGLMGNSRGMEFFEGMYDDQLSRQLSAGGGIGLGQMIYEKLKTSTVPHQKIFS